MATSKAYGEHPALMFGFLFCVDAGLLAIALWRRQPMLHVLGGVATLVVFVAWMSMLYGGTARVDVADTFTSAYPANLGYVSLFVALYLASGLTVRHGPIRLEGVGRLASYAAPLLLFVFPTVVAADPGAASPALPFAVLFALLAACAAFAAFEGDGIVYFVGAFMTVAAEAAWSAKVPDRRHAPPRGGDLRPVRPAVPRRTAGGEAVGEAAPARVAGRRAARRQHRAALLPLERGRRTGIALGSGLAARRAQRRAAD